MKRSLLLVLTVLIAACGGSTPAATSPTAATSSAATTATAQPTVANLSVGYSEIYEGALPLWYALDNGIFRKNFLNVDAKYTQSSTGVAALLANQIDVFMGGGSEVLSAQAGGANLSLVGNLVPIYPYVFLVPADIKTLADLKGKKVGVSSKGSTSDIATRVGLKAQGVDPDKDVDIIAVGSSQNRTAALQTGQIQGGLDQPPGSIQLQAKGFHVLFDEVSLKLPVVNNGISLQKATATSKKDVIQRYIDSLVQAIAAVKKDKPGTVALIKKYLNIDDDNVASQTYDYAIKLFPQYPQIEAAQLKDSVDVLGASNDKIKGYDLSQLIDQSFVKSAQDRKVDQQ